VAATPAAWPGRGMATLPGWVGRRRVTVTMPAILLPVRTMAAKSPLSGGRLSRRVAGSSGLAM
jgi:hypothetical protein